MLERWEETRGSGIMGSQESRKFPGGGGVVSMAQCQREDQ